MMMATMNSPEYEEVLKIVGAKFKHDFNQRNTNSSSSSSTNLPPGPEDMSQAMASSQFLFAEDRSHGIVNNTLIFELTDCGYKEVLASEDRHNYYMFSVPQMIDKARREAAEQRNKQDAKKAKAAIREAVRLQEFTDADPLLITALAMIADMAEPEASITSMVEHIEVLSHWESIHGRTI